MSLFIICIPICDILLIVILNKLFDLI